MKSKTEKEISVLHGEKEDTLLRCLPGISRQGKKILVVLVVINFVIIWFIYRNSNYFQYLKSNSMRVITKTVQVPLYTIPIFHIPLLNAEDLSFYYVEINSKTQCLDQGTHLSESRKQKKCICVKNWYGPDCGIPASVWKVQYMFEKNVSTRFKRRDRPRRIILSLVHDESFDILDINIQNSISVVDVILVVEERNHTPSVLNMFKQGQLSEFQNKILPIQLSRNILEVNQNERTLLLLKNLWNVGWKRLADFRPDDLFLFSRSSSIISSDVLLFLKLYDGYPDPFSFSLRSLLFKFSRILSTNVTFVPFKPSGSTFQFIATMCDYSITKFLTKECLQDKEQVFIFQKKHWYIEEWTIGDNTAPSGWQCTMCCNVECILKSIKNQNWVKSISSALALNLKYLNESVIQHFLKLKFYHSGNIAYETVLKSDAYFSPKINEKYSFLLE